MSRINKEIILKIIVILGFTIFYIDILRDGSIINYVHPRVVPFAKVSVLLMIIIIACLMFDIRKSLIYKKSLTAYLVFAIVFIIIFFNQKENINVIEDSNRNLEHSYIENSINYKDVDKDNIIINEKNFMEFINKAESKDDEYLDKDIEISGFIYRDDKKKNEVYLARNVMVCCSADMETIGVQLKGEGVDKIKNDTWVKVVGRVNNSDDKCILEIKKIIKVDKPKLPYVYPY